MDLSVLSKEVDESFSPHLKELVDDSTALHGVRGLLKLLRTTYRYRGDAGQSLVAAGLHKRLVAVLGLRLEGHDSLEVLLQDGRTVNAPEASALLLQSLAFVGV